MALATSLAVLLASSSGAADPLTLDQALAIAEQRNASLSAVRATVAAAQGELEDVRAPLWNNPEITAENNLRSQDIRSGPSSSRYDAGVGLSQRFELGGQQWARRGAAQAGQQATRQSIEDMRREVRGEAARRFIQVLSLQQRMQMEERALDLLRHAADLTGKRVKAGEASRLDGNLAAIEAERGANQAAQANEQLLQARAVLSAHLQLDSGFEPEATGDLDAPAFTYTLNDLLAAAARRPKLQALAAKEQAAQSRLDLERGNRYPDLTVGLSYNRENEIDTDTRITTLSLSLPLPLFRRNATGIGRARTELDQVRIERQAAERATQATVTALWQRVESLRQRVDRLQAVVLPSLEENQTLSLKALKAGEIGLSQFLLVRRQALDGRRDFLDARTELRLTVIELETAAGWPEQLPPLGVSSAPGGQQ